MSLTLFFAAMYASDHWYQSYLSNGNIYHKARAMVTFDRVLNGGI